jgi:hypothetical protein
MGSRRTLLVLIAWVAGGAAATVLAADHPDFSGTWKMDEAKRPADSQGPREVVLTIQHQDPQFNFQAKGRQSNYAAFSETHSLTTDGKPTMEGKIKVVAEWQDQALVTRYVIGGEDFMVIEYRLSADGKQLTRDLTVRGNPAGRETYDRQ